MGTKKWGIGRRVYYALIPEKNIILLLGGNKNGQDKDIAKAKKILTDTSKMKLKTARGLKHYSPTERLLDEDFIAKAVWECLKDNDYEGVVEVIEAHLRAVNKTKAAKDNDLARSTMYNAFKSKTLRLKLWQSWFTAVPKKCFCQIQ